MPRGNADVTRSKLLDATDALLTERPGRTPTVAELCARADVNVAMVKYCFGSKERPARRAARALAGRPRRRGRAARALRAAARGAAPPARQRDRPQLRPLPVRQPADDPAPDAGRARRRRPHQPQLRDPGARVLRRAAGRGAGARGLAADRLDAVLLLRRRRLRVPVLGAPAARARLRRADRCRRSSSATARTSRSWSSTACAPDRTAIRAGSPRPSRPRCARCTPSSRSPCGRPTRTP